LVLGGQRFAAGHPRPAPTGRDWGWTRNEKEGIYTEDAEGTEATEEERRETGTACLPLQGKELGAEEDGFALEHFDGDEEGGGGVDAGGGEDDGD
jgi:hypothetical protein